MYANLVDICLANIAQHFERHHEAFTESSNDYTERMLEFLQRKYSFDLLSRISARGDPVEKYVDILVNKYLRVLDTSWLANLPWEKVTSKIAEIGSSVERIVLRDIYFEEFSEETPWQDIIMYLPNLKSFIQQEDCNDLILKKVAKFCLNIEEIDVQNSSITIEAIKGFCINGYEKNACVSPKLKKLYIAGSNVNQEGVKYVLKNLPSIEIIDYPEFPLVLYSMHVNDLASLDKVGPYNIVELDMLGCTLAPFYDDLLKICLTTCPHLKCLMCGLVSQEQLKYFPNLPDLEKLSIEKICDSEININTLLKSVGRKLTYLSITKCIISVSVLAESCPRVKDLNLNQVDFLFDKDSKPILNSLSSCIFQNSETSCAKAITLLLSSSTKLESLSFLGCNLSPDLKAHILKCCELYPLKRISFFDSAIEKEYIKDLLLNCHTLSYLNIEGCFGSDDEYELLSFAEILVNKPEIDVGGHLDFSDYEGFVNGNYVFDDYELDYDDEYDDYDDEDYDDYDYDSEENVDGI